VNIRISSSSSRQSTVEQSHRSAFWLHLLQDQQDKVVKENRSPQPAAGADINAASSHYGRR